jgi:cell division protein FtsX
VRVAAAAVLVLGLAACGGSLPKPLTAAQKAACTVHVYFSSAATRAEERSVAAKLRRDSLVAQLTYVSKAQALAEMKKQFPKLAINLPSNPLPDSYAAAPDQLSDLPKLAHSLSSAHWPGVQTVRAAALVGPVCGGGST